MQDFEQDLRTRIAAIEPGIEFDELVQWIKDCVLKSYRNGQAAGQKPTEPRSPKYPPKAARRPSPAKPNGN